MNDFINCRSCSGSRPGGCMCPLYDPCPPSGICNRAFARYDMIGNGVSGSYLTYVLSARNGDLARLQNNNTMVLSPGYVYFVGYSLLATPGVNSYIQVLPYINGEPRLFYGTFAPTNSVWSNASLAGSFLVNESAEKECSLQLRILFAENTRNIDATGVFSVFPVAEG